jgi:hypothetical protein
MDKPWLNSESVKVIPNMPPKLWWDKFGKFKVKRNYDKYKLVYIGACDVKTMYIREILDWVSDNKNNLEITFICHQMDEYTKKFILNYKKITIQILPEIDYYNLPNELVKYDIGLVLYKGHIPNYVYNVPNKVFEYLACGLYVLCDNNLKTTKNLGHKKIKILDFNNLNGIDFLD